ncbi:uncharacterized threonine-rich GPI-anchored glycoprotein PJ4664.02-like [Haliotis rubra]|uniref:uncharacterized threonine-rich GPI-anchored glycoprotein PJ4664.02-like n=1 Tax=Haliotis rubra TaxID=36100 RepID=UPI001EE51B7F|nr:uncharacterized threonine-rich GPI-anchored glycoprotein PJ4664.02-like [Haliotis rubra]
MGPGVVFGVILLSSTCLCAVPNQFGREFIVVFIEHVQDTSTLELFLSTEEPSPVSVTVSAPLEPETQATITTTVNQGESTRVTLSKKINLKFSGIFNRGVSVISSGDICVQGFTQSAYSPIKSAGAFLAYPVNSFAKEYIAITYCEEHSCEIAVVSSVNDASVTVHLKISNNKKVTFSGKDFFDGDTVNITLDRHQTVQLQSSGDLTGSRIISSEPVGVFVGTDLTSVKKGGVGDFIVEQLLPSHVMGMDYFLAPFPGRTVGDVIKIVAEFANTKITFQAVDYVIANAGDTLELPLPSSSPSTLISNKRIVVAQLSQSYLSSEQNNTNPSMMIIPPKEQWLQNYVFAAPQLSSGFYPVTMAILAESACKNDIVVDSVSPTLTWSDVDDVAVTYVTLNNTSHTLRVKSSCGSLWGYLYGTSYQIAWSMPIGWNMMTLPEERTTTSSSTSTTSAPTTTTSETTITTFTTTTTTIPTTTTLTTTIATTTTTAVTTTTTTTTTTTPATTSTFPTTVPSSTTTSTSPHTTSEVTTSSTTSPTTTQTTTQTSTATTTTTTMFPSSTTTASTLTLNQTNTPSIEAVIPNAMSTLSTASGPSTSTITPVTSTVTSTYLSVTSTVTPITSTVSPVTSTVTPITSTVTPITSPVTPVTSTVTPATSTVTSTVTSVTSTVTVVTSTVTPVTLTVTSTVTPVTSTIMTVTTSISISSVRKQLCICTCVTNLTNTKLTSIVNDIKKELLLPKQYLSATIRKLTSVADPRPSAAVVGSLGVILITFTLVALLASDAIAVLSYLFQKMKA